MIYNATCPYCGQINKRIYLEETHGRFICEKCKSDVLLSRYNNTKSIPLYNKIAQIRACKVKTEFEITRPVYSNLEMNIRLFYFCAGNPNRTIAVEKINADVSLGKGG